MTPMVRLDRLDLDAGVDLSGGEGALPDGIFWAHRTSSDPMANMTVSLGTGWAGWRLGEGADCGGQGSAAGRERDGTRCPSDSMIVSL